MFRAVFRGSHASSTTTNRLQIRIDTHVLGGDTWPTEGDGG
jgi:hypothetical protein